MTPLPCDDCPDALGMDPGRCGDCAGALSPLGPPEDCPATCAAILGPPDCPGGIEDLLRYAPTLSQARRLAAQGRGAGPCGASCPALREAEAAMEAEVLALVVRTTTAEGERDGLRSLLSERDATIRVEREIAAARDARQQARISELEGRAAEAEAWDRERDAELARLRAVAGPGGPGGAQP